MLHGNVCEYEWIGAGIGKKKARKSLKTTTDLVQKTSPFCRAHGTIEKLHDAANLQIVVHHYGEGRIDEEQDTVQLNIAWLVIPDTSVAMIVTTLRR